jgi:hypothetical protein
MDGLTWLSEWFEEKQVKDLFLLMQEKELRLRTDQSIITGADADGEDSDVGEAEVKKEEDGMFLPNETVSERVIRASQFVEE